MTRRRRLLKQKALHNDRGNDVIVDRSAHSVADLLARTFFFEQVPLEIDYPQ
jgi:hypothetical protein